VTNEQEVESLLESYGFYSVDPSTLSFTEQILLFSQAKFIVSASGAALVNMIWAPAGAKVAVLMNDSKVANYWYFGNIAFSAGHQLSYVLGEIVENGCWSDINHSDFRISISSLNDALNYFGLNTQASHAQSLEQVFKFIFEIALEYQKNEQLDKAASAYKNLLRLQPMHAEASYNLGLIEFYNQLKDSAIIRFELAVQLKSECEQYWVSYIDALMDKGSIDIAVDALALGQNFGLRASTAQMMADSYLKEFEK
jgi:tetratricopeptide (TPR) repeat protein